MSSKNARRYVGELSLLAGSRGGGGGTEPSPSLENHKLL